MDHDYEPALSPELEGQTSINDHLPSTPAIQPIELREPTDAEIRAFCESGTP